MEWVKYTYMPKRRQMKPLASLHAGGRTLWLNRTTIEGITEQYAECYYDANSGAIGIKPLTNGSHKIIHTPNGGYISIGGFVSQFEVDAKLYLKRPIKRREGMLVMYPLDRPF